MWTLELHLNERQCDHLGLPTGTVAYLRAFDVDAYDGLGEAEITLALHQALRWRTPREALDAWQKQSTVRPYRGDGKPNKPLSAYTVSPIEVTR